MMDISKLFPSKYVKASDLNGKTITVAIARMVVERMGEGQDEKPVLYFEKAQKGMVLNRTNGMIIAGLYGPETDTWRGKRITLYATKVRAFGATHDAIRVREQLPAPPQAQPQPAEAVEEALHDAEDVIDTGDDIDADLWETTSPANRQPA